jgi:hypothetical protein
MPSGARASVVVRALNGRLAVDLDVSADDRRHQALDAVANAVIALVQAAQLALGEDVHHRLIDLIPGVRDQHVVGAPVDQ